MLEKKIRIISAGAGSGKTHRLTEELSELLQDTDNEISPRGIVATTFTRKAAAELVERLRQSLFKNQRGEEAEKLSAGLIGTVNAISGILLQQVSFEAGISPQIEVIAEEDQQIIFNRALADLIDDDKVCKLEEICERLEDHGWKEQLKGIVDAARSNNCSRGNLSGFAQKSISSLMKFIPAISLKSVDQLDGCLAAAISKAIADIKLNTTDTTKGTKSYLDHLEGIDARIKSGQLLSWKEWVDLATKSPTKASESFADPVRNAASVHDSHPRFHEDITDYITVLFKLAAELTEHYQEYKRERGMMDFVDQESQLLQALELPEVRERLAESLDLLLVDEFQDTSPIQLALFLKITEVVKQSIWVGDPKQSIYGFRGADPALMAAVTKAVKVRSADVQTSSYRSRKDLVEFVNGLFVPAFAGLLPRKQVELKPERPEPAGAANAIRLWPLASSNKGNRISEIADGIVALLREAPIIFDKHSKIEQKAKGGDIAVLCRSHDECKSVANALAERGLRVAIGRPGLLETPEGKLVIACLRYFLNEYDTLANAEIQILTSSDPRPEEWLADRLEWLEAGNKSHEWGGDHPVLSKLKSLVQRSIEFSPSEALDELIEATDLRRLIIGWGERERRLGNLENLREKVRTYEDSCRRQMAAATVSGFLLWLSDLTAAGKDNQAEGHGSDAVSVLTCHSSKGLEWPIVVVASLDAGIRERVWGVTVNDDRTSVPLTDPLSGRWIRLWPWPYGQKSVGTGLKESMQGSTVMNQAHSTAVAEELRLLYVTLTRARDYLVLCINNKGTAWLDLALKKAGLQLPPLDTEMVLPLAWGGDGITVNFQVQHPKQAPPIQLADDAGCWVPERTGRKAFLPARVYPSKMELPAEVTATVGKALVTGKMIKVSGNPSYENLGNAIHGFIAVDCSGERSPADRSASIEGLLERYGVTGAADTSEVLANCDGFYKFLKNLGPNRIHTEWPLQMKLGDQLLIGTADMLLDTAEGWVVIDHKTYPGAQSQWPKEAEGYAGQLRAYSEALKLATGKPVAALYIHFVIGGGLVSVEF